MSEKTSTVPLTSIKLLITKSVNRVVEIKYPEYFFTVHQNNILIGKL